MSHICHHVFIEYLELLWLKDIATVCCGLIIAIFGIAYPILIDTISDVGTKYNSKTLNIVRKYEFPHNSLNVPSLKNQSIFEIVIILNLIAFIPLFIDFSKYHSYSFLGSFFDIIAIIVSIFTSVLFILWVNVIKLYKNEPNVLLNHLIKKFRDERDPIKKKNLYKTILEFGILAQINSDRQIDKTIFDFLVNDVNSSDND